LNPDGSFSYTPDNGFSGHDSFIFKANDGNFDSNNGTVTLRVDNQAPVASDGVLTVNEDSTGQYQHFGGDRCRWRLPLTFSKLTSPANGTVNREYRW